MNPLQQPFVDGGEYEVSPHDHTLPSSWLCHPRHADSTTYGRLLVTWWDKRCRLGFCPLPSQRRKRSGDGRFRKRPYHVRCGERSPKSVLVNVNQGFAGRSLRYSSLLCY